MNIDKFKQQHAQIYSCIEKMRQSVRQGIVPNAGAIARLVVSMSSLIKLHLAVEDQVLYPSLSNSRCLAQLGRAYQDEMQTIASEYDRFARKWNIGESVARDPEGFRADANVVLKKLFQRIRREDSEFYPAIESM